MCTKLNIQSKLLELRLLRYVWFQIIRVHVVVQFVKAGHGLDDAVILQSKHSVLILAILPCLPYYMTYSTYLTRS